MPGYAGAYMRIYLPATLPLLAARLAGGSTAAFPAGPAFAVTGELREWYASGDTEELEYAAMTLAAEASLRLLAADPTAPRRRVVVAADIEDSAVTVSPQDGRESRGRIVVAGDIPLARIAAIHVDDSEAVADVTAALERPDDAAAGEDAAAHELLWYATQELDQLLRDCSA